VLGIRAFGGVVPGVITEVLDNPFDLSKGDFNEFQMGGRLGVGVDVLFLFVEIGLYLRFSGYAPGSRFQFKPGEFFIGI
jgi:hypothetical protein